MAHIIDVGEQHAPKEEYPAIKDLIMGDGEYNPGHLILGKDRIQEFVASLSSTIANRYAQQAMDGKLVVVANARNSMMFATDFIRNLHLPAAVYFISTWVYFNNEVKVYCDPQDSFMSYPDLEGKTVVYLNGPSNSSFHIDEVKDLFFRNHAQEFITVALVATDKNGIDFKDIEEGLDEVLLTARLVNVNDSAQLVGYGAMAYKDVRTLAPIPVHATCMDAIYMV